jgi:U3 small nucleolar RNA-associated protein 4
VDGALTPRRVRAFSDVIKSHFGPKATFGATALSFNIDGTKLILGLSQGGLVVVVEVNSAGDPKVLRVFDHHHQLNARTRLKRGVKSRRDIMDIDSSISPAETGPGAMVVHLATSYDGQWLASTDLRGCTHVFNLDSIQVRVT